MDGAGGILAAVVCGLLLFAIFPLLLWRRRSDAADADNHRLPPQPLQEERVLRGGGAAAARRMRRRPAAASSSAAASTSRDVPEDDPESDDEEDDNVPRGSKKKEKKKQEREAQRQADEAARDSRRTKQDRYAEMRRKKDEEREAQERLLEEEARARKAKEDEAAALEFEKWKGAFSVDAEGTTETQDDGQGLLHNFVEYIKKQKCVPLEDLAGEFGMRTQDCINRIITLEGMDRLSGVMDDRGKFIYISIEEMQAVADYIRKHGRVSISHLANNSNQFIDLEPKPVYDEESRQDEGAGTEL